MKFSAEWLRDGDRSSPELLATACQLAIDVAGVRVTRFADHRRDAIAERVVMPAYPLADGFARKWWILTAGRTGTVRLRTFRDGFAVPDLQFSPDGQAVHVSARPLKYESPQVHFIEQAEEIVPRDVFERDLRTFIENVLERLTSRKVQETPLSARWTNIRTSLENDEERAFCEAAGALGVDPYVCSDLEASVIEQAASQFHGDALSEFLAGEREHAENVVPDIEWISKEERSLGERIALNELYDWAKVIREGSTAPLVEGVEHVLSPQLALRGWPLSAAPWESGYVAAREVRSTLGRAASEIFADTASLAKVCGGSNFLTAATRARGLRASLYFDGKSTRALVSNFRSDTSSLFALARAVGDFIIYVQLGRSPITNTQSYRQAVGRAFAAELLAPAEIVIDMFEDGLTVEEIAVERHVDTLVIQHQLENSLESYKRAAAIG
jgi:hypothetical protein